jgi:glyoxylase-like metal-dependent hydrolase (beta-lactamase superfamily II)
LWAGPLVAKPLSRMLVTHMHPDHVGNAQWLIDNFSGAQPARLWMSAADHLAATLACRETTGYGGDRAADYFLKVMASVTPKAWPRFASVVAITPRWCRACPTLTAA